MIQLIRIDDRLLHGQVVMSWKAVLDYQAIVIVDDKAAADPIRKQVIKIATPPGTKSIVLNLKEACTFLNSSKLESVRVFVIVASTSAALVQAMQSIKKTGWGEVCLTIRDNQIFEWSANVRGKPAVERKHLSEFKHM